jgi:hypothetical protein
VVPIGRSASQIVVGFAGRLRITESSARRSSSWAARSWRWGWGAFLSLFNRWESILRLPG